MAESKPDEVAAVSEETPSFVQDDPPESNAEEDWEIERDTRDFDPAEGSADEPAPPIVAENAPSLDTLTAAIPESNRELLEELFRGRFVRVRKFDPGELR